MTFAERTTKSRIDRITITEKRRSVDAGDADDAGDAGDAKVYRFLYIFFFETK